MIKFWLLVVMVILCLIGIAIFIILLVDDYVSKLNLEIERLKEDKRKALELIQNDYFEDGSFNNYYEVLNLLKEGK